MSDVRGLSGTHKLQERGQRIAHDTKIPNEEGEPTAETSEARREPRADTKNSPKSPREAREREETLKSAGAKQKPTVTQLAFWIVAKPC